ncbi:MAG: site-2 protease family protein [Clostridia bacterium]|nr:site-2 protease family protein [Clostridia bacterium]
MDRRFDEEDIEKIDDKVYDFEPLPEVKQKGSPKFKKGLWAALGGLGLLLLKFKTVLLFALGKMKFLFIFLKLGKLLTTFGSMLLMIVVYARIYSWKFAVGFVLLLFVHELGHYWTAKYLKLNVSVPVFIPFFGALISMKEMPKDAVTEAKMAAGGPLLGSLGALVCFALYSSTGENFYLALTYTGFMINLFNLIPVHPLDGGRIVSAISPLLWLIGLPIMLYFSIKYFSPIMILLIILGSIQVYQHYKSPNKEYYNTPWATRILFATIYFGLGILLGIGTMYIHSLHSVQF